jgi:uncharacterized protein (TIGR02246 family)
MTTRPFIFSTFCALLALAFAHTTLAGDAAIEKALRDLDAQWSAAAAAKDLDKTVSYYAADALLLPPNAAAATTKEAIRTAWKQEIEGAVSGSWKATKVDVAKSGDLAYITGTYEFVSKDESGKQSTDHGKYLEVFRKQADGSWKATVDIWNSDLAAETEKK